MQRCSKSETFTFTPVQASQKCSKRTSGASPPKSCPSCFFLRTQGGGGTEAAAASRGRQTLLAVALTEQWRDGLRARAEAQPRLPRGRGRSPRAAQAGQGALPQEVGALSLGFWLPPPAPSRCRAEPSLAHPRSFPGTHIATVLPLAVPLGNSRIPIGKSSEGRRAPRLQERCSRPGLADRARREESSQRRGWVREQRCAARSRGSRRQGPRTKGKAARASRSTDF